MAPPTRIGIDLCQSPLLVGGFVLGKHIVAKGSKGVNLSGANEETQSGRGYSGSTIMMKMDDSFSVEEARRIADSKSTRATASPELVHCFEDASRVVKSNFGSSEINSAIVVVPNSTNNNTKLSIEAAGNRAFVHVLQVIPEYVAVAAAYAEKTKPTHTVMLTIVSFTAGVYNDVRLVSINPSEKGYNYKCTLHNRQTHDDGKKQFGGGGIFGSVESAITSAMNNVNNVTLEAAPFTEALEHEVGELLTKDKSANFDTVVFVGKSAELENMREMVNKGLPHVKEWKEIDDSEQLAAYGAAVLASLNEHVNFDGI